MVVTATGVLTFITACTTSGATTRQYSMRESGIQVLQTEHGDCDTGRGAAGTADNEKAEKVRFTLTSEQDVDTAYARIKRAFGFQAPDERAPTADTQRAPPRQDAAYLYRAAPGIAYSMREKRQIDGHAGVIQIDIERAGSGSRLAVLYYAGGKNHFPRGEGFRRFIETKVRAALRSGATANRAQSHQ
jgi:hypothetical protein